MNFLRASGILLHPSSLPGPFGIGDLGSAAYAFADFLDASGQSLWQVLPMGPTGYGDSPYACYSAFAGNTLFISPEKLRSVGLLAEAELANPPEFSNDRVDFAAVHDYKDSILRSAFVGFKRDVNPELNRLDRLAARIGYATTRCARGREAKTRRGNRSAKVLPVPLLPPMVRAQVVLPRPRNSAGW